MPIQLILLLAAMAVFVGGHFALSHALRNRTIALLGETGFRVTYMLVSAVALTAAVIAFRFAPRDPVLWSAGLVPQIVYDALSVFALVLLAGSFSGNPALMGPVSSAPPSLPTASRAGSRARLLGHLPSGVFQITRHPMMFGIALFSIAEIVVAPGPREFVFFGGLVFLAIYGSSLQDRKLAALDGPLWETWMERTSFWPNLRRFQAPGLLWLAALIVWLGLTWAHTQAGQPVGIWVLDPGR
jgi:uncharacterized membrane protein